MRTENLEKADLFYVNMLREVLIMRIVCNVIIERRLLQFLAYQGSFCGHIYINKKRILSFIKQ